MPRRTLAATCAALLFAAVVGGCQGNVFSLKVGDCFNGGAAGTEVSDVTIVDCAKPHDAEVFSVFDYPNAPSDFPGTDALNTAVTDKCNPDFETYVGKDYNSSTYGLAPLLPTEDGWKSGDHEIVCLIVSGDSGQLTGSAKGTAK